jgi:hypothetical protein
MDVGELVDRLTRCEDPEADARARTVGAEGPAGYRSVVSVLKVTPLDDLPHVRLTLAPLDDDRSPALSVAAVLERAQVFAADPEVEVVGTWFDDDGLHTSPLDDVLGAELPTTSGVVGLREVVAPGRRPHAEGRGTPAPATGAGRPEPVLASTSRPTGRGEQRLTQRVKTNMPITWYTRHETWRGPVQRASPAVVLNVSVTGLQIEARTVPGLQAGMSVEISCAGHTGRVRVRRVMETERQRFSHYAAELVDPSRDLIEALLLGTEAERRAAIEGRWAESG